MLPGLPRSGIVGYDGNRWAQELDYHGQSTDNALERFKGLQWTAYALFKDLLESARSHTADHSESGLMTLEDWLSTYAWHGSDHVEQMDVVDKDWLEEQGASCRRQNRN